MKQSPAYKLLALVWENTPPGSWDRVNHAMRAAMKLAILAGLRFDQADFGVVCCVFRGGYWYRSEDWYAMAVAAGNIAAAHALESYLERKPFIADDVDPGQNETYAHSTGTRKRGRLAVGLRFPWKGFRVTVTSFADDGTYLTACVYSAWKPDESRKVEKRFRITVADIQADRKERKDWAAKEGQT